MKFDVNLGKSVLGFYYVIFFLDCSRSSRILWAISMLSFDRNFLSIIGIKFRVFLFTILWAEHRPTLLGVFLYCNNSFSMSSRVSLALFKIFLAAFPRKIPGFDESSYFLAIKGYPSDETSCGIPYFAKLTLHLAIIAAAVVFFHFVQFKQIRKRQTLTK